MQYELKALELMVFVTLSTNAIKLNDRDASFIHENMMAAHSEVARIKMQFMESACKVENEKQFELYIRQHQLSLIQIVDTMFSYQQPESTNSITHITTEISITRLYTELYETVDGLLSFIESRFHNYFNQDITIPVAYKTLMATEIEANIKYLQSTLLNHNVSTRFIELILHPLKTILLEEHEVTYRELLFVKELQRKLFYTLALEETSSLAEYITNLFLYMNYNCLQFFNFYIAEISKEAKQFESIHEEVAYYSLKTKLNNQQSVKPGFVYKPLLPSIKEQIGSWLAEELNFLEKKQAAAPQQAMAVANGSVAKVHTCLSVAHLSLAVKLLIDAKIITNKSTTEIIKMVARNFRTDMRENISEDSLRNKSYTFETATVNKMRDVIVGMMIKMKEY